MLHNWPHLYENGLVEVNDLAEWQAKDQGGFYTQSEVYTKVGDFWLPASNRSTSAIRLGGQANFTIDYQNYQITAATAVGPPDKLAGADSVVSGKKSGQCCSIVKNYVQK